MPEVVKAARGTAPSRMSFAVGPEEGARVATRRGPHLRIRLEQLVDLAGEPDEAGEAWEPRVRGYRYQLYEDAGTEIFACHLHPGIGGFAHPHLHISAGAGTLRSEFHRAHLPTGEVPLGDFLAFVIRDFAVRPLRDDYAAVLASRI